MAAKVIVVGSERAGAGKTHFAAGLARWLTEAGRHCAPLHLSPASGDAVACPEGGWISRAATLLAEASELMPEPLYESGWQAMDELRRRFEVVIVETAGGAAEAHRWPALRLSRDSGVIRPAGLAGLAEFEPDLMPGPDATVAALPRWSLASAPRCGVVTLPHMDNFPDYQLLRGSEWLTQPGVGRFANLFLPATSNAASDLAWLEETGLAEWLRGQRAAGAQLTVCGWDYEGAERCERGDPLDFRFLSRRLGRRMSPPLPDEAVHHRLAEWFGGWAGLDEFTRTYL